MVRFITFEGGEGTGKTTQVALLASYLSERGRSCVVTREPGGTALGKMIRKTLLQVDDLAIAPATELFLYLADRAEHVHDGHLHQVPTRPWGLLNPMHDTERLPRGKLAVRTARQRGLLFPWRRLDAETDHSETDSTVGDAGSAPGTGWRSDRGRWGT